jgi:hypothetical protein
VITNGAQQIPDFPDHKHNVTEVKTRVPVIEITCSRLTQQENVRGSGSIDANRIQRPEHGISKSILCCEVSTKAI